MFAHACICVNVSIILKGVGAEHFLGGNCGNRDITKRLIASIPGGAGGGGGGALFLAIDQTQVVATMSMSE